VAEPPDRSRGGCAERPEGSDDLLRFWKPVFFLLREDEPAVGDDVEGPAGADDQLGVDVERLFDRGRQTGGLR